jgi:hypothetical protein
MSKSFISVDKVSWKPILLSLQALFHIFLVTYWSRIMSVTKLTVPLNKIDFWKIDTRKVHQTSHIHFRYMQDTFRIISSIEFEHSIFNCILFLFASFSEEWLCWCLLISKPVINDFTLKWIVIIFTEQLGLACTMYFLIIIPVFFSESLWIIC